MKRKYSLGVLLTLVLTASALTCVILSLLFVLISQSDSPQHGHTPQQPNSEESIYGERFSELLRVIDERFIGTFDLTDITESALRGAVESLDDEWSYYMNPEEYASFLASANNRYHGIGVEVKIDEETTGMLVLGVYSDSGADLAGIVAGDIVTAVDGESILGLSLSEIRILLRRPLGETAVLTVLRADGAYHDLTVLYSIVFTNPVTFEMLPGNIGYVVLRNFEEDAGERFINAVNELIEMGAVAFIYDVRNNNGGRVSEVTQILDFLLPEGEIFISVDRSGVERITMSDEYFIDLPAVVLVNVRSYSGAEFFAAMLFEYNYAVTIGEQTTGKNRMQTTIPLDNGGAIHLSTGHYLTKNRISLYDIGGFTPEIVIVMSDDERELFNRGELERTSDPQFMRALSILQDIILTR
jgi:carboxyl-terminal processing protease